MAVLNVTQVKYLGTAIQGLDKVVFSYSLVDTNGDEWLRNRRPFIVKVDLTPGEFPTEQDIFDLIINDVSQLPVVSGDLESVIINNTVMAVTPVVVMEPPISPVQ